MSAFVSRLQKLSPKKGHEQGEEISGKTTNTNTNRQSHKPLGRLVAPEKSRSSRAHSHSDIVYAYTDGEDESGHNVHQSSRRSSERSRKPPVKAKPHRSSQLHSLDKSRSVDTSLSDSGSVSSMPSVRTLSQRYVPGRRMSETSADSDVFEAPSPRLKHHTLDSERSVGGNKAGDGRTAGTAVSGVTPRLDWRSKPTEHWTTGDVVEWSCSLGIDKLPQIFQNAGITGTHLSNITDDILVELGLRSMVDRRKFLAEVKGVTNRKLSSLWSIKQVSMKRRDLERSTDQLYANLESLQKLNEEQEKKISSSLHEIQKEQLEAEELLSRDMTHSTDSLPTKSFPEKSKKLCDWMTADVVQWLENNNLAQFISVFQENQISGKDLDDNSLSFLDCLGGVDTEGMEALLSAIYRLQNPDPVSSQQNDLEKIQTDEDRQKYIAALQVASLEGSFSGSLMSGSTGTLSSSLTDSTSTLYVGNLTGAATHMYGSTDTLSSTQTDHTSEQPKHSIQRASPRRTNVYRKKQCASPETTSSRPKSAPVSGDSSTKWSQYATGPSLFTLLDTDKPLTLLCVKVSVHSEQLGFKVKVAQKGKVMVTHTDKNAIPLRKGDRILEACGHSLADVDSEAEFMETVRDSFILDLVITREDQERSPSKVKNDAVNSDDVVVLKNKLAQSEHQWSELRTVLEELRDLDVGSEEYLKIFPISKIEAEKDSHKLEEQLQQLQTTLTNQVTRANTLERDLDTKERSLKQAEDERDRAVTKLHQLISIIDTDSKGVAYDEIDDSVPLWENLRSADKEDVLQALKDNILESTRQKAYLDHLLGVVIDQAPYLLEELEDMEVPEEASQQTVTRNIQEEWC